MGNDRCARELNGFLVEVFNGILKTEELYVARVHPDLSIREVHLIEEVCRAVDRGEGNRPSDVAAALRVTAGTLTSSVNQLESKGYLVRAQDSGDKRAVRLHPTEKGREAERRHREFHRELVEGIAALLSPEETEAMIRGLGGISAFFRERYQA